MGYGGAAPRVSGSAVVELGKRMNKILKIDADNASCVVEPGFSYLDLYDEIRKSLRRNTKVSTTKYESKNFPYGLIHQTWVEEAYLDMPLIILPWVIILRTNAKWKLFCRMETFSAQEWEHYLESVVSTIRAGSRSNLPMVLALTAYFRKAILAL
jgi:hypothetical protein